jgi:hypothetical protein
LINVDRNAGAHADRANMHIVEIDMPGDLVRVVGASAGEGGQSPMIRPIGRGGKPLRIGHVDG